MAEGRALVEAVDRAAVAPGEAVFWWLGQQGVILKLPGVVLYIDLFLSDHPRRRIPALLRPEEIVNADFVLGTHDHRDHIDRAALPGVLAASPRARLLVPRRAARSLPGDGIARERIVEMDDGVVFEEGGLHITAVKAAHEFFDYDEATGYPHLQYVIESGGVAVHHAGDTLWWEGMRVRLGAWRLTASFLPINGRDGPRYARGTLGNMTWQEAADLAGELSVRLAVPGHWDMFAHNGADPADFAAYLAAKYPAVPCHIPAHGRGVRLSAREGLVSAEPA